MSTTGVAVALVVLLLVSVSCSPVDRVEDYRRLAAGIREGGGHDTWEIIPARPQDIRRVVVERPGEAVVELLGSADGRWRPGSGASAETALLMEESEDHLFPLLAYRKLAVDVTDSGFGFTNRGPLLTAETGDGDRWTIRIGGPSPSGGGFYAVRQGDAHVYVVVRAAVNDAESLLLGRRVVPPPDPIVQAVMKEQENPSEDPEEVTNPWLAQILEVEGDSASPPG